MKFAEYFNLSVEINRPSTLGFSATLKKISEAHWNACGKKITKMKMIKFWKEQNADLELKKVIEPTAAYIYEKMITDNNEIITQIQEL